MKRRDFLSLALGAVALLDTAQESDAAPATTSAPARLPDGAVKTDKGIMATFRYEKSPLPLDRWAQDAYPQKWSSFNNDVWPDDPVFGGIHPNTIPSHTCTPFALATYGGGCVYTCMTCGRDMGRCDGPNTPSNSMVGLSLMDRIDGPPVVVASMRPCEPDGPNDTQVRKTITQLNNEILDLLAKMRKERPALFDMCIGPGIAHSVGGNQISPAGQVRYIVPGPFMIGK